jgi:Effector-associated domain 1/Trypsin-like peptidase domain
MNGDPQTPATIELNNAQRKELHGALLSAFPTRPSLAKMVDFELSENLDAITGGGPLGDVVYELIVWAQSRGKLAAVVLGARRDNPDNPQLRRFEESIVQARNVQPEHSALRHFADQVRLAPGPAAPPAEIQRIVAGSPKFHDIEDWRRGQSRSELAVCLIEIAGPDGHSNSAATGFLVAPDLVMTAGYVFEHPIGSGQFPQRVSVTFRFDYREYGDGTTLSRGQEYAAADPWLVDSSPTNELDYVLLRVRGTPGDDPVGGQAGAPRRFWLTPQPHAFQAGESLFVVQHPQAGPLKFAYGPLVNAPAANGGRITYRVQTGPGSGGAPVFSDDWALVALHEGGASPDDPERTLKKGVPMAAILERTSQKGLDLSTPAR